MKIINPLYDKAFKYLMENNRLAKKVLSVILEVEIEELILGQQETLVTSETHKLSLFRLDFKATIKEADGSRKTVLIELQKSKLPTDIKRFRNYLGANYITKGHNATSEKSSYDNVIEEPSPVYSKILPIITIYILGYNLDDLPYMAVTVNRDIINSVSKEKIEATCFFIEHLTHRSHIIQVRRLPEERRTRLEKFLTLFNQAWCTSEDYILDLQEIPEEFNDVATYLHTPVLDEKFRRQLEGEQEIETILDTQEAKFLKKIEEAEQQKEEAEQQKEEAEQQKEEAENKMQEERKQKKTIALKLARQLKKAGMTNDEIIKETGLSKKDIEMFN